MGRQRKWDIILSVYLEGSRQGVSLDMESAVASGLTRGRCRVVEHKANGEARCSCAALPAPVWPEVSYAALPQAVTRAMYAVKRAR